MAVRERECVNDLADLLQGRFPAGRSGHGPAHVHADGHPVRAAHFRAAPPEAIPPVATTSASPTHRIPNPQRHSCVKYRRGCEHFASALDLSADG